MRTKDISRLALALAVVVAIAPAASAQVTTVDQNVTSDTTWSGEVVLELPIFVKDGATLTILPGTIVRGQPRTGPVVSGQTAGSPGALIVTRSGRVVAEGNANNPIIFTTAAIDNNGDGVPDRGQNGFLLPYTGNTDTFFDDDPRGAPLAPLNTAGESNVSLWGGLVILGSAPTNLAAAAGVAYGEGIVEGLTVPGFPVADATYGGLNPHDDSGSYRYVSVRHAGDELGEGNELNGITLAGVGDGTVFEFNEVYCNFDDGMEWFGGTVNGNHLAVFYAGDDTFDLDQGYTGLVQFAFGIMPFFNQNDGSSYGSASGDRAGEWDGDDFDEDGMNVNVRLAVTQDVTDDTSWPKPYPIFYNTTIIGSTPTGQNPAVSPADDNWGIYMRHGFAGEFRNGIVTNTGSRAGLFLDLDPDEAAPNCWVSENVANDLIRAVSSTFANGGAFEQGANDAIANGDAIAPSLGGTANVINGGFNGLTQPDPTWAPTGNADGKLDSSLGAPYQPKPVFGPGVIGGVTPRGPGLNRAATFRGAFDATVPGLWTDNWTALGSVDLLQ